MSSVKGLIKVRLADNVELAASAFKFLEHVPETGALRPYFEHWAFPAVRQTSAQYGISVILMRFHFDERKSGRLRVNPKRGVGFEEV
jgi:hypothetical protein